MPTNNHSNDIFDGEAPLDDEQLWDLLSLYVDGEADPAQAAIVEQMLSSDPAYRRDFDFLMQSAQTMRMVEEVEPPLSLRETVYAKTTGRPTLVGRLRAAWNRATTPAFGRYATIGGAFAVAALGVAILGPRLISTPGPGPSHPPSVAMNTPLGSNTTLTNPAVSTIPDIDTTSIDPQITLRVKQSVHKDLAGNTSRIKPSGVQDMHKISGKSESSVVKTNPPAPHNHPLLKNSQDSSLPQVAGGGGYPYDKKMDEETAPHQVATISAPPGSDFGSKIVAIDDTTTPTSPSRATPGGSTKNSGDSVTPMPTVDPPKLVHVAVLPPDVSQNLSAEALRRKNIQTGSYDHNIADNLQDHGGFTLGKVSF